MKYELRTTQRLVTHTVTWLYESKITGVARVMASLAADSVTAGFTS